MDTLIKTLQAIATDVDARFSIVSRTDDALILDFGPFLLSAARWDAVDTAIAASGVAVTIFASQR